MNLVILVEDQVALVVGDVIRNAAPSLAEGPASVLWAENSLRTLLEQWQYDW